MGFYEYFYYYLAVDVTAADVARLLVTFDYFYYGSF